MKYYIKTILLGLKYMHERGVVTATQAREHPALRQDARGARADRRLRPRPLHLAGGAADGHGVRHPPLPRAESAATAATRSDDQSIDVWGVGLIMFIMLFGYNPFLRESNP